MKTAMLHLISIIILLSSSPYAQMKGPSTIYNNFIIANSNSNHHSLAKRSATIPKRTGVTQYSFAYVRDDNNVKVYEWKMSNRDTIIFGSNGEDFVTFHLTCRDGLPDSLTGIDSTVCKNGRVVKIVIGGNEKSVSNYSYYDEGRVIVLKKVWDDPSHWQIDSTIYFSAVTIDNYDNYNLIKERFRNIQFNTDYSQFDHDSLIISECNENRNVYISSSQSSPASISLIKQVRNFDTNYQSYAYLAKDSITGDWTDTIFAGYNETQTLNQGEKVYTFTEYDREEKKFLLSFKLECLYDNAGNLKQYVYCRYNGETKSWDNPLVKTVYTYDNSNLHAVNPGVMYLPNNITMTHTQDWLYFKGSGITGLTIYTIAGKQIVSTNQQASSEIKFKFTNKKLTIGKYFAELVCNSGKYTLPFIIYR